MARVAKKTGSPRSAGATRYDAHHTVLDKTYGAMAELRRELSNSKVAIAERTEILKSFSACQDPQRAWLILEDYFEKLSLSRKDFPSEEWWPRLVGAKGEARLEEVAMLFLKANRAPRAILTPRPPPWRRTRLLMVRLTGVQRQGPGKIPSCPVVIL